MERPDRPDVAAEVKKHAPHAAIFVQAERKGTAHAVLAARESLGGRHDDVLVAFADTPLVRPETFADLRRALHGGAAVAALGFEARNPTGYGRFVTRDGELQAIVEAAPRLADYLGDESKAHFEAVQVFLKDAGIPYRINHRLVRGLDYYNRTVFEWVTTRLGAQGTICAGGRYDGLFEQLGGKSQPAAGFAIGIERLLLLWKECGGEAERSIPDAYVVSVGEAAQRLAMRAAESLREHGFAVLMHCGGGSFKAQMKKADASEAAVAIVIGEDEAAAGEVGLKPLRGGGAQQRVTLEALPEAMAGVLYSEQPELEA